MVLVATVGLVLSGFGLLAQSSTVGSNPVVSRLASITDYPRLKKQTLDDRYYENGIALQSIRDHPVAGLGWGPDYGAVLLSSDTASEPPRLAPSCTSSTCGSGCGPASSASFL